MSLATASSVRLQQLVPTTPPFAVDYAAFEAVLPQVRALRACPQDPVHHQEGDVGIHTEMVLRCLVTLPSWQALDAEGQRVCFLACLLHDIAKPWTTVVGENGRVSAKGHSLKGAVFARRLLWEQGFSWREREQICGLIRHHQVPFFLIEHPTLDAERRLLHIAETTRCDWLAIVAEADIRGRICADLQKILDAIDLFREMATEAGVASAPFAFASDHTRFRYFRDPRRSRYDEAFDDTHCTITLLSGLPASGKSTWMRQHITDAAVISLDDLRAEHGLGHGGGQRAVIEIARERLKQRLRAHQHAVWNATSLTRDLRSGVIDIADAYGARIHIVALEADADVMAERNRARRAPVPAAAIERMLSRWEFPDHTEAHTVEVVQST